MNKRQRKKRAKRPIEWVFLNGGALSFLSDSGTEPLRGTYQFHVYGVVPAQEPLSFNGVPIIWDDPDATNVFILTPEQADIVESSGGTVTKHYP